jgi:hypothetical protein
MYKLTMAAVMAVVLMVFGFGCSSDNPVESEQGYIQYKPTVPALGDRVWLDFNRDGIQGEMADEPGIANVTVFLMNCADTTMVGTTMTDTMGYYYFDELAAGDYYLQFVLPDDHAFSPMDQGADDLLDSDVDPATGLTICFQVDTLTDNMSVDAGLWSTDTTAMVGDYVWMDANMDGIQGQDEPGLAGVIVHLMSCDSMPVMVAETVTDSMGWFMFDDVMPGEYFLHFVLPDDHYFTMPDQGDDDMLDSDVDPETGATACFMLDVYEMNMSFAAGVYYEEPDPGCTRGKGYWKNHTGLKPQPDMVSDHLPIWLGNDDGDKSLAVTDPQTVYDVLQQHTYGHPSNGITKLYAHLLTAKLNIANGADDADIADVIMEVDDFLAGHDYMDWETLDKDTCKMVLKYKSMLSGYNDGTTGPGSCADDGDYVDDGEEVKCNCD